MSDQQQVCGYRWMASRVEVETAPVEHVCEVLAGHDLAVHAHECSCGKMLVREVGS